MKVFAIICIAFLFICSCNTTDSYPFEFIEGKYNLEFTGFYEDQIVGDAQFDTLTWSFPNSSESFTTFFYVLDISETINTSIDFLVISSGFTQIETGIHKYCLDDYLESDQPCLDDTSTFGIWSSYGEELYFTRAELEVLESTESLIRMKIDARGRAGFDEEDFTVKGTISALRGTFSEFIETL